MRLREGYMKSYNKASTIILFLLMSASIALAAQKGKAKGPQSNDRAAANVAVSVFMGGDRDVIRNFYSTSRGLPPGLAKRGGDLPPGLAKQLQRNGHLPPGLEKRLSPFPVELERRLPPLRSGLMRGIIGGSAVIVNKKTSVILDVFTVF